MGIVNSKKLKKNMKLKNLLLNQKKVWIIFQPFKWKSNKQLMVTLVEERSKDSIWKKDYKIHLISQVSNHIIQISNLRTHIKLKNLNLSILIKLRRRLDPLVIRNSRRGMISLQYKTIIQFIIFEKWNKLLLIIKEVIII